MSDTSTDEKIQQLVRSVLQAVDARLDAVRHELAAFAAEEEQRHHQVLGTVAALERRVADLERADTLRRTSSNNIQQRLDDMNERIDLLARPGSAPMSPRPVESEPSPAPPDLDLISRPLFDAPHVTTEVPTVPDFASSHEAPPAPPPAPTPPPPPPTPAFSANEPSEPVEAAEPAEPEIDVGRLTALLSEKLGHFSLQPRTE